MDESQFTVQAGMFEGPLDLLLSLIQERKLYINEISLASVTDEFLKYASRLSELPLAETAQFVLIASTLLLIKSRSLLPNLELTEEEEQSIEELERRLAQYKLIKERTGILASLFGTHQLFFGKRRRTHVFTFMPAEASVSTLYHAGKHVVATLPASTFREKAEVAAVVSIEEMIENLQKRVMSAARISFKNLTKSANREEVIVHFLALLELVKGGIIAAQQENNFNDIMLESEHMETPHF